jgi:tetratricopeptide (TPR) repeat protein
VIALDGTYGFQGLSTVLTQSYGYAPEKMRAAFLDLRRAPGAQGNEPIDLSVVESFRHADRTFITIEKMHHSDFTSFAMVGAYFHTALDTNYPLNGWNRETGRAGHERVCRIVLAFVEAKLKMEAGGMTALGHEVHQAGGATLREEAAAPPPPSPLESAALAAAKGIDATEKIFVNSCGQLGVMGCLDADRFNTWGYTLFGQNRPKDALALFQLAAWAHPQSANAQDSLADGYMAVGDNESAKRSIERAIALAPNDPALDQAAKAQFVSEESTKLVKFK